MQPPTSLILLRDVYHTEGKPVAYYSKKLNGAQMNYATIENELPCVVVTQSEFHSMLLSATYMFTQTRKYWNYIMWKTHAM